MSNINNIVLFYAKYAKISSNYMKMSGFPSRNVQYPRYQDTNFLQLCMIIICTVQYDYSVSGTVRGEQKKPH